MTKEHPSEAVMTKCGKCHQPMSTPLVCDMCHTLNPDAAFTDHFTLMGLPQQFDLDQDLLYRKYVALSRHSHPDMAVTDSPEVQELHLRMSASVNAAYQTLKEPSARAAYLLQMLGGKTSSQDKSVPEGFLGTMMMMQEELADARAAGNTAELNRIRGVLQTQHDGLVRRIALLFKEHQEAVACQAVGNDILDEVRKQLNAVSFVRKLLSQL